MKINSRKSISLLLLAFLSLNAKSQKPQSYKEFPCSRIELTGGVTKCGFYDKLTGTLYNCKGNIILSDISSASRIVAYDYCCEETIGILSRNISFNTGTAVILKKSYSPLDNLATLLLSDTSLKIRVEAHIAPTGLARRSFTLTEARADSVKSYLASKGIDTSRVLALGLGETKPIETNKTAAGRTKNTRIEIRVID